MFTFLRLEEPAALCDITKGGDSSVTPLPACDNTSSQGFVPPSDTASQPPFSPSKHVEGITRHQFWQEAKTDCKLRAQYAVF